MSKVTLLDFGSDYQSKQNLNANNTTIENGFDNTLSRNGQGPNQMLASLDMNGHPVLNIPYASGAANPVPLGQFNTVIAALLAAGGGSSVPGSLSHVVAAETYVQGRTGDVRQYLQSALNDIQTAGGGCLIIDRPYVIGAITAVDRAALAGPTGTAVDNGLIIHYNAGVAPNSATYGRTQIVFVGQGALLAGSNNMIVLRVSDSWATLHNPVIDANGHTNVWGRAFIPENVTQTTTLVFQIFNKSFGGSINGCAIGDFYCYGPSPGGDSGCWYNESYGLQIIFCNVGVWSHDSFSGGVGGNNRNKYIGGRIGQNCNTAFLIESGSGWQVSMDFEGVNVGTSPRAVPTGVYILNNAPLAGYENASNCFSNGVMEGVDRPFEIYNGLTNIINMAYKGNDCVWHVLPNVSIPSYDASYTPFKLGNYIYQNNSEFPSFNNTQSTIANGAYFSNGDSTHLSGKFDDKFLSLYAMTGTTVPGGGAVVFTFDAPYIPMAEYRLASGGYDTVVPTAPAVWGRTVQILGETTYAGFAADQTLVAAAAGSPTTNTVSIARINAYQVTVTVTFAKAATSTVFTNYATLTKIG